MNGIRSILAAATVLAAGIGILAWAALYRAEPRRDTVAFRPDPGWEGVRFPDFSLVDQNGGPIDQTALDGRITIVDFIFTSCPLQCPAMTGGLWTLSEELAGTGVQMLSMSIDPERDTPERLRQYAADYDADPSRWRFVTGPKDAVRAIVRDALMFEVSDATDFAVPLADGTTMQNIIHPPHYVLIGPDRAVLGIYYYQDPDAIEKLKARVRSMAKTMG